MVSAVAFEANSTGSIPVSAIASTGHKIRYTCKVKLRQLCHCAVSGEIHGEVK